MVTRRYFTARELAEHLNVKVETINWWRKLDPPRGPKHKKFGNSVRYPAAEVERYEDDPEGYDRGRAMEITW